MHMHGREKASEGLARTGDVGRSHLAEGEHKNVAIKRTARTGIVDARVSVASSRLIHETAHPMSERQLQHRKRGAPLATTPRLVAAIGLFAVIAAEGWHAPGAA